MTPEGIEPSTFGFGIRRATNYAMESNARGVHWRGVVEAVAEPEQKGIKRSYRDSNPNWRIQSPQ